MGIWMSGHNDEWSRKSMVLVVTTWVDDGSPNYLRAFLGRHWVTDGSPKYSRVLWGTPWVTIQVTPEYSGVHLGSLLALLSTFIYSRVLLMLLIGIPINLKYSGVYFGSQITL